MTEQKQIASAWNCYGPHLGKGTDFSDSLTEFIKNSDTHKIGAIQIFNLARQNGAELFGSSKEKEAFSKLCTYNGIRLYVHSIYTSSFFPKEDKIMYSNAICLKQFRIAAELGALGVVVHIPKITLDEIIDRVVDFHALLKKEKCNQPIILEASRCIPVKDHTWETPSSINLLCEALAKKELSPDAVCICLDTAHMYVKGNQLYKSYDEAKNYLKSYTKPEYIKLIHLNGLAEDPNKYKDKHAIPFWRGKETKDNIWAGMKPSVSGFRAFIEFAAERNISCIFEVNDDKEQKQFNALFQVVETLVPKKKSAESTSSS